MQPLPTREDFVAAAKAARGRPLALLYQQAGIAAGPSRLQLAVEEVELPLRLFVALALRRRLGSGADLRHLTHAACLSAVEAAGLALDDRHGKDRPIRTG